MFTCPSMQSTLASMPSSLHRASTHEELHTRMPKMSQKRRATRRTLPRPGRDRKSALTTTFSSGIRLMTRSGRNTRMVRSARTQLRFCPARILPTMPMTTMKPVQAVPRVPHVGSLRLLEPQPERHELHDHLHREQDGEGEVHGVKRVGERLLLHRLGRLKDHRDRADGDAEHDEQVKSLVVHDSVAETSERMSRRKQLQTLVVVVVQGLGAPPGCALPRELRS